MRLIWSLLLTLCFTPSVQIRAVQIRANEGAVLPAQTAATVREDQGSAYYWRATPATDSAQILTLFCRSCGTVSQDGDIPLVAVLRDTLGDTNSANDRLTSLWLLSYAPQSFHQRVLAAVPFFYWRLGSGITKVHPNNIKPLLDLTTPEHTMASDITRDILQWTAFDPMTSPIRATSRAYRTNALDHQRLHLEETIGYLRNAPTGNGPDELTQSELNLLMARLELRTRLLGGLVDRRGAERLGEEEGFDQERIRSRNWELLRILAERTGLVFESVDTTGTIGQYGLLWYPLDGSAQPVGSSLNSVWKVLNIRNPWTDERLRDWRGPAYDRLLDQNGALLPQDSPATDGARAVRMVPLGAYSMSYPKLPLLLIDFRDKLHVRRHEITQRIINEVTAGVIGISHFTNWYFYVGADLYDFVTARHGSATDQNERLDSYSQFRAALALDRNLDPDLRSEMQRRIDSLSVNPLEASPQIEVEAAVARSEALTETAATGERFDRTLDRQRRAELAAFGKGRAFQMRQMLLHVGSFGLYASRARRDSENLSKLDRERRIQADLDFLDLANANGTEPEVAYRSERISQSVDELSSLLHGVQSHSVNAHATAALTRLRGLTIDREIQADCSAALAELKSPKVLPERGIAVKPRVVASAASVDLVEAAK